MCLNGLTQGVVQVQAIVIAPTVAGFGEDTRLMEVSDDLVYRTLGDAHAEGDIAQSGGWILGQAYQHVSVVAEEGPGVVGGLFINAHVGLEFDLSNPVEGNGSPLQVQWFS